MNPWRTEILANGLTIEFFDRSNRYFGDYWHIDLEARCRVLLETAGLTGDSLARARAVVGEWVDYLHRLEKMGVPTEEVASNRDLMAEDFLASVRPYLGSPVFARQLVGRRLEEARLPKKPYLVR